MKNNRDGFTLIKLLMALWFVLVATVGLHAARQASRDPLRQPGRGSLWDLWSTRQAQGLLVLPSHA